MMAWPASHEYHRPNGYPSYDEWRQQERSKNRPCEIQHSDRPGNNQTHFQPNAMPPTPQYADNRPQCPTAPHPNNAQQYQTLPHPSNAQQHSAPSHSNNTQNNLTPQRPNNAEQEPLIPAGSNPTSEDLRRQQNVMTEMNRAMLTIFGRYQEYSRILPYFVHPGVLPLSPLCFSCTKGAQPPVAAPQGPVNSSSGVNSSADPSNERIAAAFWRQKCENLKAKISTIQTDMRTLQQNLQSAYEERKDLENRCVDAEAEAKELRQQQEELRQEQSSIHARFSEIKNQKDSLGSLLQRQSDFQRNMYNCLKDLGSMVYEGQDVLSKLHEEWAERTAEMEQMTRSLRNLQRSCTDTTHDLQRVSNNVHELKSAANVDYQNQSTQTEVVEPVKSAYANVGTQPELNESCHKSIQTLGLQNESRNTQLLSPNAVLSASTQTQSSQDAILTNKGELQANAAPSHIERSQRNPATGKTISQKTRVSRVVSSAAGQPDEDSDSPHTDQTISTKQPDYGALNLYNCRNESEKVQKLNAGARQAIDEYQRVNSKHNRQTWSAKDLLLECFEMLMPEGAFTFDTVAEHISENGHFDKEQAVRMLNDIPDLARVLERNAEILHADTAVDDIQVDGTARSCRALILDIPDDELLAAFQKDTNTDKSAPQSKLKRKLVSNMKSADDRQTKKTKC